MAGDGRSETDRGLEDTQRWSLEDHLKQGGRDREIRVSAPNLAPPVRAADAARLAAEHDDDHDR